jgi:hypothetical protein
MIRLDCAKRASAISLLAVLAVLFGATPADARKTPRHHHAAAAHHVAAVPVPTARALPESSISDPALKDSGVVLADPTVSIISEDQVATAETPTIVRPSRRIYCVEFARLVSGIALFGDAKTWWDQARNVYAELTSPTPGSVMVFAGRKNMRSGHVAVVKRVISSRQVVVDHANWGRDGKIYLNAPVIDVSANNDWSLVKVWNTRAGTMGSTAYALKGFIAQRVAVN